MEISSTTRFWTIAIFVVYSVLCIILSNWSSRKSQKDENFGKGFYAGGGQMHWLPAGMMIAAAACSGGTFLSNPGLSHSWGLMWPVCMGFTVFGGAMAGIIINKKLRIVLGRIHSVSLGTTLKHRYSNSAFIGWYVPIAIAIFSGLFLYQQMTSGAKLMETVTGLPYVYGLIIFGMILLAYTIFSGAKGQAIVSIFQGIIMTITTIAMFIGIVSFVRGQFGTVTDAFKDLAVKSPSIVSPWATFGFMGFVSFLFNVTVGFCGTNNVAQANKVGTCKDLHNSIAMTIIFVGFWSLIMPLLGTLGKTVFPDVTSDTIIPYAAMATLPPIFAGIVVSGVTAAIHSTIAFNLLNINSVLVMDLIDNQIMKGKASDEQLKKYNSIVTVVLVVLMVVLAIKPPALIGVINNFSIAGGAAAFFMPVLFGVWWPKANKYGCIASMVGGVGYYLLANYNHALCFGLSNPTFPCLIVAAIIMVVVSLATPAPDDEILDIWFGVGKTAHKA